MTNKRQFAGERVKLGELGAFRTGGTPSRKHPEYYDGSIPWVSTPALNGGSISTADAIRMISQSGVDNSSTKLIPAGSLMVGIRVGVGKVAVNEVPMCTNQDIVSISGIDASTWDVRYLSYAIQSRAAFLRSRKRGATITGITTVELKNLHVPWWPVEKQVKLARTLDGVKLLIDGANEQLKRLDALVKSRFVEMFGDPVDNPKGWKTASLTSLGSCKNGMNFKSKECGIELPCLGVGDFKDRSFINDVSEMGRVSLDDEPAEGYFLRDGDIVFVRSNGNKRLVGRCLAVYPHGKKAVYSGFCIRLRIESEDVRVPYLIWALKHPAMRQQMFGRGANVQNLNQKLLAKIEVPLPPLPEQDRFLDFVAKVDKPRFIEGCASAFPLPPFAKGLCSAYANW